MARPIDILKRYFGYESFRPGQEKVIDTLLEGRDCLAIMPTGAGKSICFQVPALLLPGITLIVSPLISLMKDQVDSLVNQQIPATYINSQCFFDEAKQRFKNYTGRADQISIHVGTFAERILFVLHADHADCDAHHRRGSLRVAMGP